jgi:citrate lyase subunit beta/citryl-CoA lyase
MTHPRDVFLGGSPAPPRLPSCDHYASGKDQIAKAIYLQAELNGEFDVTIDMEDGIGGSVTPAYVAMACEMVHEAEHRVGVRLPDDRQENYSSILEQLLAGCGRELSYLTIPKVWGYNHLCQAIDKINAVRRRQGVWALIPFHVIIETRGAFKDIWDITAHPYVQAVGVGLMDLVADFNGLLDLYDELVTHMVREIAIAAHCNGVTPVYQPSTNLNNFAEAGNEAWMANLVLGYHRMFSIHPRQIKYILSAMRPDRAKRASEIKLACDLLCLGQEHFWQPINFGGELCGKPSYREAWRVIQQARKEGVALTEEAERCFFEVVDDSLED